MGMAMKTDYSREDLISICERAVVPECKWHDRDSAEAQKQIGQCWAWLKAGCEFTVQVSTHPAKRGCFTDERTIWVEVRAKGFTAFEYGDEDGSGENMDGETFYLPTIARLESRVERDWY